MATVKLPARPRTAMGKQGAKHTREDGQIPAVVYGEQEETLSLQIDSMAFRLEAGLISFPVGSLP